MVWVKNCEDDDWINLDNVFSISFQQMNNKEDWIEFLVRPSNARILEICLEIGPNPNPDPHSKDITWDSRFYDRAMIVTDTVFETIKKADCDKRIRIDLQEEIQIKFENFPQR